MIKNASAAESKYRFPSVRNPYSHRNGKAISSLESAITIGGCLSSMPGSIILSDRAIRIGEDQIQISAVIRLRVARQTHPAVGGVVRAWRARSTNWVDRASFRRLWVYGMPLFDDGHARRKLI